MNDAQYAVVFYGEVVEGFEREQVIANVRDLFKVTMEQAERIFAQSKVVIKGRLDQSGAQRYADALTQAGAKVAVETQAQAQSNTRPMARPTAEEIEAAGGGGEAAASDAEAGETPEVRELGFEFSGQGFEYFKIWIVNLVLTIVTLGIYSAWAKVRNKQYFYGNTQLDGAAFEYTGKPVQILKGRIIAAVLFLGTSLTANLNPILPLVFWIIILIALPWMVTRSLRFNAHNSVYRNVRLRFTGTAKGAAIVFVGWPLLALVPVFGGMFLTMSMGGGMAAVPYFAGLIGGGLVFAFAYYKQQAYMVSNHAYGTAAFEFNAEAKDYIKMFVILGLGFAGIMLLGAMMSGGLAALIGGGDSPAAMGPAFILFPLIMALAYLFAFAYFAVRSANIRFNNTNIQEHHFGANYQLRSYAALLFTNTLMTVITIGLFRPWAKVRTARYKAQHTQVVASGSLDRFAAAESQEVSALGEEVGDMFDIEFGL